MQLLNQPRVTSLYLLQAGPAVPLLFATHSTDISSFSSFFISILHTINTSRIYSRINALHTSGPFLYLFSTPLWTTTSLSPTSTSSLHDAATRPSTAILHFANHMPLEEGLLPLSATTECPIHSHSRIHLLPWLFNPFPSCLGAQDVPPAERVPE